MQNLVYICERYTEVAMPKENTDMIFYPHVSVDCVVFGFDGNELKVLLIERKAEEIGIYNDMKLPGSPIYEHEDVDEAAVRVLTELTGLKDIYLRQFKTFGALDRTKNPKDVRWLEMVTKQKIGRIITVAYLSLIKIDRKLNDISETFNACWCGIGEYDNLAFDHTRIIEAALNEVRRELELEPSIVFELLPKKFVAAQLRKLYEVIYGKKLDVRNFHKKMALMKYLVPLDEVQKDVPHRSARYFKFDKAEYNKRAKT